MTPAEMALAQSTQAILAAIEQPQAYMCDVPDCIVCAPRRKQREEFPSLSLMQQPARGFRSSEPLLAKPADAPAPRIKRWYSGIKGVYEYRCKVDAADQRRRGTLRLLKDYVACGPEGWGNTPERAWNAWVCNWGTLLIDK